jgi:quinol monooxygenase YgiN
LPPIFGVSVAGCLGYDVLVHLSISVSIDICVSVAGCLGYDVLVWLISSLNFRQ